MVNRLGDSTMGTLTGWLNGLSRRQSAVSDNIANIDTPGYRRKEVAFETELMRATNHRDSRIATTDPRHIATSSRTGGQTTQATQLLTSSRLDSNNVDIDQEMVTLSETQLRYQAASSALNTKLATIRNVIRG
jgi:flagellar basal-body rod protein FlgB